jgi:hypothetical protein
MISVDSGRGSFSTNVLHSKGSDVKKPNPRTWEGTPASTCRLTARSSCLVLYLERRRPLNENIRLLLVTCSDISRNAVMLSSTLMRSRLSMMADILDQFSCLEMEIDGIMYAAVPLPAI